MIITEIQISIQRSSSGLLTSIIITQRTQWMIYEACIDPENTYCTHIWRIIPFSQVIFIFFILLIIQLKMLNVESLWPGHLYILYPHHPAKNVIFMLNLFGQVLINVWTIVAIMSNIYLWIYLRSLSLHSIALKEVLQQRILILCHIYLKVDKKKCRKRNLVPARVGFLQMMIYITTYR